MQGSHVLGKGDLFWVGYTAFEVVGGVPLGGAREGDWLEPKTKNRAAGAWFWRMKCGGACIWVVWTYLGWGAPDLRWWGGAIGWRARGGLGWSPKPKIELPELGFGKRNARGLVFG